MLDVIIIGAGVNGCFAARTLAKYQLDILLIDKESDVGNETSSANSAIVHSGYDPHPGTWKAKLNVLGNKLYDQICKDLDVEFDRIGSLTLACNPEEVEVLDELIVRAKENNVKIEVLEGEKIFEVEPFATRKAVKAILAPTAGIINPFELCVALCENAMDNGVMLHLNEEVTYITKVDGGYEVRTDKGTYYTKAVINAAGVYSDRINNFINDEKYEINPRKGEYYVLDHFPEDYIKHTLFSVPTSKGKGVLVTPTTHGNYLVGPSSIFVDDKSDESTNKETLDDVRREAFRLVDNLPMNYLIREFAGLRAYHKNDDFIINKVGKGFINLVGIQSPGLASAPATALEVEKLLLEDFDYRINPKYNPIRRPLYRLNKKTMAQRDALIKENPLFGNMVCRCEKVSEGEVVDAIRRNCGARTIKGVKKRVRPGFGKCQGGFCEPLIMKILARELGKDMMDINYDNKGSYILQEKNKGEQYE